MGKLSTSGQELAESVVSGSFTATGQSSAIAIGPERGGNVAIYGTFVGTVSVERSFDGGTNWIGLTDASGNAYSYTDDATFRIDEDERGVLYRLNCSAYTSGTINYRLST